MPTAFIEERLDPAISYGSKGGPEFNTSVFEAASGYEQRNKNWQFARCRYDISYGIKTRDQMDEIIDFFYAVGGRATGFRYKDWLDYRLVQELIGTGNGSATQFQIKKTYAVGTTSYERVLRKIVAPFTPPAYPTTGWDDPAVELKVYVNDVLQTTGYTVNYNTGVITFTSPVTNGHTVKVSCEFDVPVRFDSDKLDITLEAFELETMDSIPLLEIKTDA
ncbi:MAG: DUF2460 domain-containing protein [Betaproteobacteria bacterium]